MIKHSLLSQTYAGIHTCIWFQLIPMVLRKKIFWNTAEQGYFPWHQSLLGDCHHVHPMSFARKPLKKSLWIVFWFLKLSCWNVWTFIIESIWKFAAATEKKVHTQAYLHNFSRLVGKCMMQLKTFHLISEDFFFCVTKTELSSFAAILKRRLWTDPLTFI